MLINENGLARAVKSAYKDGGYSVMCDGDRMAIYTKHWLAIREREKMPRKVLGAIAEHAGIIQDDTPMLIHKGGEPKIIMADVAQGEVNAWTAGNRVATASYVPVILQGYQVYQAQGGTGPCYGIELPHLEILERLPALDTPANILDGDRLAWHFDDEVLVLSSVRKAAASWAEEWERAVWTALEGVNLHRARV